MRLIYLLALCVVLGHCESVTALADQRSVDKLMSNLIGILKRDSGDGVLGNMFGISENNFNDLLSSEKLSPVDLDTLDKMSSFEHIRKPSNFENMFSQSADASGVEPTIQLTNSVDDSVFKQDSSNDGLYSGLISNSENNFRDLAAPEQFSSIDLDSLDKLSSFEHVSKPSSFGSLFSQSVPSVEPMTFDQAPLDASALAQDSTSSNDDVFGGLFGFSENNLNNILASNELAGVDLDSFSNFQEAPRSSRLGNVFSQINNAPQAEPLIQFTNDIPEDGSLFNQDVQPFGSGIFGGLFGISDTNLNKIFETNELAGVDLDAFSSFQHVSKPSRLENAFSQVVDAPTPLIQSAFETPLQTFNQQEPVSIQLDSQLSLPAFIEPSLDLSYQIKTSKYNDGPLIQPAVQPAFKPAVQPVVQPVVQAPAQTFNKVSPPVQSNTQQQFLPVLQPTPDLETIREPSIDLSNQIKKSTYYNGNELNKHVGGLCRDFFNNNTVNTCCSKRDDECYMVHYGTRLVYTLY